MNKILKLFLAVLFIISMHTVLKAQPLALENAFPNVGTFSLPLYLTHSNDSTNRIFVVQQRGLIYVFPNDSAASSKSVFLNLTNKVSSSGSERGLLGLAFHPDYLNNGYLYVNYTRQSDGATIVSRFSRSTGNPNKADSLSELVILTIPQPYSNHNGGMILFGLDGYMYIAMGDGGSGGDPENRSQNPNELLGKLLRINVDTTVGAQNYGIPSTNMFAGGGGRGEIYVMGMRNPWRFSQDRVTGQIWCGDVGQGTQEEIDLILNGRNYGWRCYEGMNAYNTAGCSTIANYTFPKKVYGRSLGFSVTGGYVYRGTRRPELYGRYLYADYGSGRIWKFLYHPSSDSISEDAELMDSPNSVASFGMDQNNEMYIVNYSGTILRFNKSIPAGITGNEVMPENFVLKQNYPNPFNPATNIQYSVPALSKVSLVIYNASGEAVRTLVNTTQSHGNYNISWNGDNDYGMQAPSGVYFYVLSSGSFKASKKMVLVK